MRVTLLLLLLAVAARADPVALVVGDLEDLAGWCAKNRLLGERDRLHGSILELDPDHARARKQLKYTRDEQGTWTRKRPYRAPKNSSRKAWPEYERRMGEIRERFAANVRATIDKSSARDRERALQALRVVDPENEWAREQLGEVRTEGEWRLQESVRALSTRRPFLGRAARTALAEAKEPKAVEPREFEKESGITWTGVYRGELWRGAGTVPADELRYAVRLSDACHDLFKAAFGKEPTPWKDYGFYLVGSKRACHQVVRAWPGIDPDKRDALIKRDTSSKWLPGARTYVKWSKTRLQRIDAVTRQAVGVLLVNEFGLSPRQGWAWEGFGIHLGFLLTGSRQTTFVRLTGYAEKRTEKNAEIQARLAKQGADWLALAAEILDSWTHGDLISSLSKDTNQLTMEDLLVGHALASYLLEGFPPEVSRKTLRSYGGGKSLDEALVTGTGRGLQATAARLRRWLVETR